MPGDDRIQSAILRWLPAVAWMALIFYFSSQSELPGPQSHLLDVLLNKGAHFVVYAILALLLERAVASPKHGHRLAFALTLLYGMSDELHQSFTPGRTPQATDVMIDAAGALFGLYGVRQVITAGRARSSGDHRDPADDAPPA